MSVRDHVDVVMIGAGWTASILAWKLASAGVKVRSLEQGQERWTSTDFQHNHDALRYSVRKALMTDLNKETWTWRPNPNLPSLPFRRYSSFHPGSGTGGSGVHWSAQIWRYFPHQFNYRSHHIERYGEDRLPEGTTLRDWPLTFEDLEPHYHAFEYDTGVSGRAGNLNGTIVPGGNPFEGPRSAPYPLPPLVTGIAGEMFGEAATELGYHPFPQPASILSQAYTGLSGRPRSACLYCGYCTRHGCEVDAKSSPLTDHLPAALETRNYDITYGAKVTGIIVGEDGLARGLRYIDLETGEEHEQPADTVILSGYTLTNVRMLLLSQSDAHPDGVGNDRGRVGKNYTYQLNQTPATGVFDDRRFNLYMGNYCTKNVIQDLNADNFDHSDLDFLGGGTMYTGSGEQNPMTSTLGLPPLDEERFADYEDVEPDMVKSPVLYTEVSDLAGEGVEWGQGWKENLRQHWDNTLGVSIMADSFPYDDQFLDLDPTYTDAWGQPLLRITYEYHENDRRMYAYLAERASEILEAMGASRVISTDELDPYTIAAYQTTHCTGGAIMGGNPDDSVTNKYGQVWDTPNVFVTGAALYPQQVGLDHTGTVTALAYHTGDAMVDQYLDDPTRLMD